jgi:hypothetical protein
LSDWEGVPEYTGKTTVRYEAPPKGKKVAQKPAAEPAQVDKDDDEYGSEEEEESESEYDDEEDESPVPAPVVEEKKEPEVKAQPKKAAPAQVYKQKKSTDKPQ